jgi:hypothetical protein
MKRTSVVTIALTLIALLTINAAAPAFPGKGDKKDGDKSKKKADLVEMTLTGVVISAEHEKKGKDGSKFNYTSYYLKTDAGKVHLPQPRAEKKGEDPPFRLKDFVDANVEIKALGVTNTSKKGKYTHVHRITNIRRVEA